MQGQGGPRLLGRRGMLVTTLCWRLQVQPLCHSSIGGSCHHLSSTCSTGNQQGSRHLLTRDRHHDDASPAMRTHGSCGTVSGDSYSSGFTLSCRTASGPTSCSSSWLSGGCLCRALRQHHRQELGLLRPQRAADDRRVGARRAGREDVVALRTQPLRDHQQCLRTVHGMGPSHAVEGGGRV